MLKLTRNRTTALAVVVGVSEDRPLTRDDGPKTSVPKAGAAGRPARTRRSRSTRPPALPAPETQRDAAGSPLPTVPVSGAPVEGVGAGGGGGPAKGPAVTPPAPSAEAPAGSIVPRVSRLFRPSVVNVKTAYACYLVSLAVPPAALVGLLIAYEGSKSTPAPWLATHYTYQLRTFWMGLALNVIAWTLLFTGVGLILYPLIAAWVVARAVKGITRVATGEPIEDPHAIFV